MQEQSCDMDKSFTFPGCIIIRRTMSDIKKYPINPIQEKKLGDWSNVAELIDYKIVRTIKGGLLGLQMADVLFLYKKTPDQADEKQKRLQIYGDEGSVFKRSLDIIERKKNPKSRHEMITKFTHDFNTTKLIPVNQTAPGTLLGRTIENTGYTARQFAQKTGLKEATLYHHVGGGREISQETAIQVCKKLNCDPVDLMFDKKTCPVWAKCDLLNSTELEDVYTPGRLFSYAADAKDFENVIVPRDLYRPDVKAIKIVARGSMYDNKIAFYYRSENKAQNILNQLCVVGVDVQIGDDFTYDTETRYYFGLYEEVRGQCNLINPDPYSGELENKFILKNFKPNFITPVAALVNPDAVRDQTDLKKTIPQTELFRREEILEAELARVKRNLYYKDKYSDDLGDVLKKTKAEATKIKTEAKKLSEQLLKEQAQLQEDMKKISEAIAKEMYEEKEKQKLNLFKKLSDQINKKETKFKIVGGKDN